MLMKFQEKKKRYDQGTEVSKNDYESRFVDPRKDRCT